jgi:hypothetical protein
MAKQERAGESSAGISNAVAKMQTKKGPAVQRGLLGMLIQRGRGDFGFGSALAATA